MTYLDESLKILIVEDDEQTRFLYSVKLKDYQIEKARNGEDGFEKYLSFKPDIILTDLSMPKMDGTEMVAKIREQGDKIPVIVITGADNKSSENAKKARDAGANAVLQKPFTKDALLECIFDLVTPG